MIIKFETSDGRIEVDFEKKLAYFQYQDYECPLEETPMEQCWLISDWFGEKFQVNKLFNHRGEGYYSLERRIWKRVAQTGQMKLQTA